MRKVFGISLARLPRTHAAFLRAFASLSWTTVAVATLNFGLVSTAVATASQREASTSIALTLGNASDSLGIDIHFTEPVAGEMQMISNAGFKWVRMDLYWSSTETRKGSYDFSKYDNLLRSLDAHHIRAVLILDYVNRLYDNGASPYTPAGRDAFVAWAEAAVLHFAGRGVIWEMYNEPDLQWSPTPNAAAYAKLALAVGLALADAAPTEPFVGPSLSGQMRTEYLDASLQAGLLKYWSGITIHPYTRTGPENATRTYALIRGILSNYGPDAARIPILCSEWGYSRRWSDTSGYEEAEFLPRAWMTNMLNDVPLTIWYDWRDDPPNDQNPDEAAFGIVARAEHVGREPVFDPHPAYVSAKVVTSFLSGYHLERRLVGSNPEDFVLLFESNSGDHNLARLAVWTTGADHNITIENYRGRYGVISYLGEHLTPVYASSAALSIHVTGAPQYLSRLGSVSRRLGTAPKVAGALTRANVFHVNAVR
jgi:hypothetical protein